MEREWNIMFGIIVAIALIVWGWAIYATIYYWSELPNWVQILALLGLFTNVFGGPIVSLLLVYLMKK